MDDITVTLHFKADGSMSVVSIPIHVTGVEWVECAPLDAIEEPMRKAPVISLEQERDKRACKRCDGIGIIAVEVPLPSFTDCLGIEGLTCPDCEGKGFKVTHGKR